MKGAINWKRSKKRSLGTVVKGSCLTRSDAFYCLENARSRGVYLDALHLAGVPRVPEGLHPDRYPLAALPVQVFPQEGFLADGACITNSVALGIASAEGSTMRRGWAVAIPFTVEEEDTSDYEP